MPPLISVIIPTFNRTALLKGCLESLATQSLPHDQYEVVVVDDGSTEACTKVCEGASSHINLRYFRIEHSGISSAKNLGIFVSRAPILLFFDDDDVADEHLLQEHLKAHRENPDEGVAVLGYTSWHYSALEVTPVMEYVTEIGQLLMSYPHLKNGQVTDFTHFWGGRLSCKRSFLAKYGIFNQEFQSIIEDIELGYRLSKFGLKVVFNRSAVSYMARPITYDEFCRRCESKGRALLLFRQLYPDPIVQQYCQVSNVEQKWQYLKRGLEDMVRRVRQIESLLASQRRSEERDVLLQELQTLYGWTFEAFRIKGIVDAKQTGKVELLQRIDDLAAARDAAEREAIGLRYRFCKLNEIKEAAQREAVELQRVIKEQAKYLDTLATETEETSSRETQLQEVLISTRDELLYRLLINRMRGVVRAALPPDATVLIVSKGDDELLKLDGRRSWHFPQNEEGSYAGHYPADSAEAIAHLEALRDKGAEFLLFPGTLDSNKAFWWLEYYGDFREHLKTHYQCIWSDESCIIYRLVEPKFDGFERCD